MRPAPFESPGLQVVRGADLPLSGPALLGLMAAVLARGMPFRFRARGWSMAPFIRDGDVITVSPLQAGSPAAGDVVAFARPQSGNLVVHRVVGRRGAAALLIRGDSVPEHPDGLVPLASLLGQVTRIERNGRALRWGLGPERRLIAWLSRTGLLVPLRGRLACWLGLARRGRRR